ncbi:hypothetical protein ACFSGI_16085 [Paenibacillus nicotianae]|uniref:Uncharacterized protein n=1 Tax=Paenibacillus nicotianae TaxID=1526551 RepID=A0ABW4UZG3_9BACL
MTDHRLGIKMITLLYGVILTITVIGFVLLASFHILDVRFWVSLATIVLAETIVWSLAGWGALRADEFKKTVPAFMGLAVVAVAYQALTIMYAVLLWLVIAVPTSLYIWIQLITFGAVFVIGGLLIWFMQTERGIDKEERLQMLGIQEIRSILSESNLHLKGWQEPYRTELKQLLTTLEENVRFSDPVTHPDIWAEEEQLMHEVRRLQEQMMQSQMQDEHKATQQVQNVKAVFGSVQDILQQRNRKLITAKS